MADTSRAELFATQSLGSDAERIKARLGATRVVIGIEPALAKTRLGQIGLVTATNILGRLGALLPNLYVDVPSGVAVLPGVPLLPRGQPLRRSLVALTRRLASLQAGVGDRRAAGRAQDYDYGLFIGRATAEASPAVTVGSNRWLATVRPDGGPEPVDTSDPNPLGIILAAALGSAEIVKHMWLPIRSSAIAIEPVGQQVTVSAYDLSVNSRQPENPPMPDQCFLGHACVFGLGATGSGCMYVLGCLPRVRMSLDLVDMDPRIEPSNIERLFTCSDPKKDVGRLKTDHALDFVRLAQPEAKAFVYPTRFQQFVDADRNRLGYVWCCLDNTRARRDLQTELASIVVNGGTDASRWMLSSHEHDRPENACLLDLYPEPETRAFDPMAELGRLLGMGPEQIRQWVRHGRAIDVHVLDRAAARERDPARRRALLALKGKPFFQAVGHVCATMSPNQNAPAGTISFVALMPAIAMVSDLLKRRLYGWQPAAGDPNVFRFDALRSPARGWAMNIRASRRCLCQSENYRQASEQRQKLRRSHLGRSFAVPAPLKKTPPKPELPRRHAPAGVARRQERPQRRPVVRAPARPLPKRHNPAPQARQPPAGTWDKAACRIGSALLALMGIGVHFAGLAAGLVLIGLFVAHESGAEGFWRPWRLVPLAWRTPLGFVPWLKFAGVSVAPLLLYDLAMSASMLMLRGAHILERHPVAAAGLGLRRHDADILVRFYAVTSLPVVGLGAVALSAISLRCLRPALAALPCCAFVIIPLGLVFILGSSGVMIALPLGLADKRQKKLFPAVRK